MSGIDSIDYDPETGIQPFSETTDPLAAAREKLADGLGWLALDLNGRAMPEIRAYSRTMAELSLGWFLEVEPLPATDGTSFARVAKLYQELAKGSKSRSKKHKVEDQGLWMQSHNLRQRESDDPRKQGLPLDMDDLSAIDNGVIEDMAKGLGTKQSAAAREIKTAAVAQRRRRLQTRFRAQTPAHLVRKIVDKKYGRLPMKEIHDYPLETKLQLTVLQYLSFGFTREEIALRVQSKNIRDTRIVDEAIWQILEQLGASTETQAVYTCFNNGLLGSEDQPFVDQKEAERLKGAESD